MTTENKYSYIGRLFLNKDKKGETYLKGKIKHNGIDLDVVGFLNEVEIKSGADAGKKVKAFSIALSNKKVD